MALQMVVIQYGDAPRKGLLVLSQPTGILTGLPIDDDDDMVAE